MATPRRYSHGTLEKQRGYSQRPVGKAIKHAAQIKFRATAKGCANNLVSSATKNSKQRKHVPPTITRSWVLERLNKGCSVTGLPFVFDGPPRHPLAPSLDRIDNSRSYSPDNVRVVCWAVNSGVGTWGLSEYLRIAKVAVDFQSSNINTN